MVRILSLIVLLAAVPTAAAQVSEVVVGLTPSCPYGLIACWGGGREALLKLDGVGNVAAPDAYNCTAALILKDAASRALPDVAAWKAQFVKSVGNVYDFRGVEVTVMGTVSADEAGLHLRLPNREQSLSLGKLEHKLQWNFQKRKARQPEPEEAEAYADLLKRAQAGPIAARLTGPLVMVDKALRLEVREFLAIEGSK